MKTKLLLKSCLSFLMLNAVLSCGQTEGGILPLVSSDQIKSKSVMPAADAIQDLSAAQESVAFGKSEVWACKSTGAKKYHYNKDCGGLNRCSHDIEKLTAADAEAVGLTACAYKTCH